MDYGLWIMNPDQPAWIRDVVLIFSYLFVVFYFSVLKKKIILALLCFKKKKEKLHHVRKTFSLIR